MNKNIAILGDEIGLDLGKKSGETDINYFSKQDSGDIYSIFVPKTYPEKIQSMLVALGLSDFVVLHISEISWKIGEQIVAIDALRKPGIILSEDWVYEQIKPMLKGTVLDSWENISDERALWEKLRDWDPPERDGLEIWIDQAFKVKSVGTVALGIVKAGEVSVHDKLTAHPSGKEVEVRSIQLQDKDQKTAGPNSRVGLALKNIEPEDLPRGSVLGDVKLIDEIPNWKKLPLYKGDEKKATHVFNGINFVGVQDNKLIKQIPVGFSKRFLLVENVNKKGLRIVGYGDFE